MVGLTAVEHIPLVLIDNVLDLDHVIDRGAFIGPDYVALRIIRWHIRFVPAGLALATCLAVAGFAIVARRVQLGQVTRIGDS